MNELFSVRIDGLAELVRKLKALPDEMARNTVRGAMRAAAIVIRDEARRRAPIGKPSSKMRANGVTAGALRKSIRVSARISSKRGLVSASVKAGTAAVWYAPFVERGTQKHWIYAQIRPSRRNRRGVLQVMKINTMNKHAKRGNLKIGSTYVGSQVIHPGARANPFMKPAFDSRWRDALRAAEEYIAKKLPADAAKL